MCCRFQQYPPSSHNKLRDSCSGGDPKTIKVDADRCVNIEKQTADKNISVNLLSF